MFLAFVKKYIIDISVIVISCIVLFGLTVLNHGLIKPYTREVATISPLVFAFASLALLGTVGLGARWPWLKRLTFDLAIASLFVPLAMLKAEMVIMPLEYFHGAGVEEVTQRIASNDDSARYRAWARLVTMDKEQKDDVARQVAGLLMADDPGTRSSARLTLDVALRKNLMAALTTLSPDLKTYLAGTSSGAEKHRADLAGAFAQDFVESNVTAIRKAIDPKERIKLPAGSLEALVLALAADDKLGAPFLRGVAESNDPVLQPLATEALKLKDGAKASH